MLLARRVLSGGRRLRLGPEAVEEPLERVVQRLEDLAGIPAATNEAAGGKHDAIPAGPPRALKEDELKKLDDAVERLEAAAIGESRV